MIMLLITLIAIVAIGFMWGGFIALTVTLIAAIVGYFTGTFGALTVVLVVAIGSLIQKFSIIDLLKIKKKH
jgi:hypothetical protein